jgi:2-methylcitrate dehydratase PrpD
VTASSTRGATATLSEFVSHTRYEDLPPDVVAAARIAILDGVGNLLAGCAQPVAQLVSSYVREMGGTRACTVVGRGFRTNPPQAAFANGVALHCLDFEVQGYPAAHGTSAILPPALALSESSGGAGRDVIAAYTVGWEIHARIRSAGPHHQAHPFHPPGVFGPLGSAASSASMLRLGADEVRTTFGIAASRTGGLFANNGTMVKATHPGNAGRLGLEAALLARAGFSSNDSILEAPQGYVDTLFGGEFDWDALTRDLGTRFRLVEPGFNIKRYPAEIYLQWLIDAVLNLRREHRLELAQVEVLEVEVPAVQAALSRPRPRSGLDGKFSWEYCAAVALADGHVDIDSFTDAKRFSPPVEQALEKVQLVPNSSIPTDMLQLWVGARARLNDGRSVETRSRSYRGSIADPMNREERLDKFYACGVRTLDRPKVARVQELIEHLEDLPDTRELMTLLAEASAA